jgi:uncharacterized protein (DUF58 family)
MSQQNPTLRRVGLISLFIGILLGILVIVARVLPDMESTIYGFIKYGYPRLTSLSCPVLMTSLDRLPVTIRVHNPLDKPLSLYINSQLSSFISFVNAEETVVLQPGETRKFAWEVGKENIDLHYFIFARVFSSAAISSGMKEATCGTLVLDLPFKNGPVIFYIGLVLAILTTGLGLWFWLSHSDMGDPVVVSRGWWMRFVALLIAVGIVAGILNWWFLAILTLLLTLLLSVSVFLIPRKV